MADKPRTTFDGIEQELKRAEDILGKSEPRFKAITDAITRIGKLLFGLLKWALPAIVACLPPFLIHLNATIGRSHAPILYGMRAAAAVCICVAMIIAVCACWPEREEGAELLYAVEWLVCLAFSVITILVAYAPA